MTPIAKTSAPELVEARPARPAGDARRISSLGGQPTIHADPAAGRRPVHVKPAWQAPKTQIKITLQSLVQGAAGGNEFKGIVEVLGASKLIRQNIHERLMFLHQKKAPTEDEKDEYTKLCCTIIKSPGVPWSQTGMVVGAALRFMNLPAGRS